VGKAIGGNAIDARIAAAQGLSEADAHGSAGFIDAEGCGAATFRRGARGLKR
jgi:hypothetical protein